MSTEAYHWERRLVDRAYDGVNNAWVRACLPADRTLLERAYARSDALTRLHSRTFYLASGLLPRAKRRAVRALYAFCRTTDDLVDRVQGNARVALDAWRRKALGDCAHTEDLNLLAWLDTQQAYGIPGAFAEQLIDGIARDLIETRYTTFDQLTSYCYGVASTVGLMAMYIIGFRGPEAIPYAVKLGVALQLTNILRDVGEDWRLGRLYLPQDELAAFGLTEGDLEAGRVDGRWRAFMRFQIERVRRLYAESLPGVAMLHRDGRLAIAAAAELYRAILDDIEAHDMDVFRRRAHVSTHGKLLRLPGIAWRAYVASY